MAATVRMASVGVDIIIPLTDSKGNPIDLEFATVMTLFMTPPNTETTNPKNATKVGSGKDGQISYRTQAGDLTAPGDWKVQARVQFTNPVRDWYSEIYPLVVAPNLDTFGVVGTFRQAPPRVRLEPPGY